MNLQRIHNHSKVVHQLIDKANLGEVPWYTGTCHCPHYVWKQWARTPKSWTEDCGWQTSFIERVKALRRLWIGYSGNR
jgi:hypothetical protein